MSGSARKDFFKVCFIEFVATNLYVPLILYFVFTIFVT